jgi:hypothetical protein
MKFSTDDQEAMLSALGEDAVLTGGIVRILFQAPGEVLDGMGGIITTNPTAQLKSEDINTFGIIGGMNGTAVVIDDVAYTVLSVIPDGDGFSTITLEMT